MKENASIEQTFDLSQPIDQKNMIDRSYAESEAAALWGRRSKRDLKTTGCAQEDGNSLYPGQ
jgi:hypothetical protein